METRRLQVLIIDDDAHICRAVDRLLRATCDVDQACDGEQALAQVRAGSFDVILCDLLLKGEPGLQLAGKLVRAQPHLTRRIILMSGATLNGDLMRQVSESGHPFIEKPFSPIQLVEIIERVATARS